MLVVRLGHDWIAMTNDDTLRRCGVLVAGKIRTAPLLRRRIPTVSLLAQVRQDSALQSPNLPNAWIQEGDMLQQVADIVKVQVRSSEGPRLPERLGGAQRGGRNGGHIPHVPSR